MQEGVIEAVYSILSNSLRAERGPGAYPKTKTQFGCQRRQVAVPRATCTLPVGMFYLLTYLRAFSNHSHSESHMVRKAPFFSCYEYPIFSTSQEIFVSPALRNLQ